jgi:spermidine synthase
MNNLYSEEFYEIAKHRLSENGVIAQWVPFHLVDPEQSMAIVRTFIEVFPNSVLWRHPDYATGILLGRKSALSIETWPGLERKDIERELNGEQIRNAVIMNAAVMKLYSADGTIITDDNQYLSYGWGSRKLVYGASIGAVYEGITFERIDAARRLSGMAPKLSPQ